MNLKQKIFIIVALLGTLMFATVHAQEISVTASVSQNPVGLNQQLEYKISISGKTQNLPDPKTPDLSDFRILAGPNSSTSIQWVNGALTASKTFSYVLIPRKIGRITIAPAQVKYKGTVYQSKSLDIIVSQDAQKSQQGNGRDISDVLFMRVEPSKRSAYVNERIDVSFKIYFRVSVRSWEFLEFPETVGFWSEDYELPQNVKVEQTQINGVQWNVATIKKIALYPSRAGELEITPMRAAFNVVQQRRRRNSFDIFDNFFDSSMGQTAQEVLQTRALKLQILPLPAQGKPPGFSGLVGEFSIRSQIDKTEMQANDALSYQVNISGSGNLQALKDLPVKFPTNFEVFDPKIKNTLNRKSARMSAAREVEYILIPQVAGNFTLEPLRIPYFDPQAKSYRILETPAYDLVVNPGKDNGALAGSGYVPKSDVRLLGRDINFIREGQLELVPIGYRVHNSPLFWGFLLVPAILLGAAYGYRQHLDRLSSNVHYARSRVALKQATRRLKTARELLDQQDYTGFYAELSNSLIGFVADKFNRSAAGMMRDDVVALLKQKQVDAQHVDDFVKQLDEADFRRFAPSSFNAEDARESYRQAESLLVTIGKSLS